MVDLHSTFNHLNHLIILGHQQVPLSTKKKSRRLKFVNNKFSASIKNSSEIFPAAKLCISFQISSKG